MSFTTHYIVPEQFKNDVGKAAEALMPLVTEKRLAKMNQVVQTRSRQICAVFENTHHAHNISAVLRTMDAFGLLDVFFLYHNPHMKFKAHDSIDRSASKWLMVRNFQNIQEAIQTLKENGYKIALVSRPDFSRTSEYYRADLKSISISQLYDEDFLQIIQTHKIALIFGTELYGLSEDWIEGADFYLSVDMYGFCESLNVSVCAGIVFHAVREMLTKTKQLKLLSHLERNLLLEHWIAKDTLHASEYILNRHPELMDWYQYVQSGKFY